MNAGIPATLTARPPAPLTAPRGRPPRRAALAARQLQRDAARQDGAQRPAAAVADDEQLGASLGGQPVQLGGRRALERHDLGAGDLELRLQAVQAGQRGLHLRLVDRWGRRPSRADGGGVRAPAEDGREEQGTIEPAGQRGGGRDDRPGLRLVGVGATEDRAARRCAPSGAGDEQRP